MKPSSFYRGEFWELGLQLSRRVPPDRLVNFARRLSSIYWRLNRKRRKVVIQNLLPLAQGDVGLATRLSVELFENFACKLLELWQFETGGDISQWLDDSRGDWGQFCSLRADGRGVLLMSPHLGNWELGGPLLARRGVQLRVVTLVEPHSRLTKMREESRARWGIETVVIGQDPFAFVEVIRRLEQGGIVAMLVDRPAAGASIEVQFCGRTFRASTAPAELARATGCHLIPTCIPKIDGRYEPIQLPEVTYDRAALETREARMALTGRIVTGFEAPIRRFANQWYHFVPVW